MQAVCRQALASQLLRALPAFLDTNLAQSTQSLRRLNATSRLVESSITCAATTRHSSYTPGAIYADLSVCNFVVCMLVAGQAYFSCLFAEESRADTVADVTVPSSASGSITVIIGPMFAGKTKELLRHVDHFKVPRPNNSEKKQMLSAKPDICAHHEFENPLLALSAIHQHAGTIAD